MAGAPILLWSAGEASGDRHAAHVVRAIHALRPDVRSVGLGGPEMAAAGVELLAGMEAVTAVGVTDVLARWREILAVRRRLLDWIEGGNGGGEGGASLFVPVDFPGLNLRLAGRARRAGVPVVYFISPQIWAWGAGRIAAIRARVERMLVFFDFEERLYREAGVPVTLVGHPLVEQMAGVPEKAAARRELDLDLDPRALLLVLMPGSRPGEVGRLLPPMLEVARRLRAPLPDLGVLVRVAPGLSARAVEQAAARAGVAVRVSASGDPRAVRAADLALVAAGTATLETALLGTPMLVLYRVSRLTYAVARRVVTIPSIALVNVVAERPVVPEFVQERLRVDEVEREARRLLTEPPARARQIAELVALRARLGGPGAAGRAAAAILAELERVERREMGPEKGRERGQERRPSRGGERGRRASEGERERRPRPALGERLARTAYTSLLALSIPALARRRRHARDPAMRRERRGHLSPPASFHTAMPRLWLHGASVGEISALPPILAEVEAMLPRAGTVLSAFTDTGLAAARRLVGRERSFALPIDLPRPLGRAFATLAPAALIVAETELWPGLLGEARRRGVGVAIVNGRLSPASVGRYRWLRPLFAPGLRGLAGVAAQSEADAERFAAIGVPADAIAVTGSSKFDVLPRHPPAGLPAALAGRPVVVAGSTGPGDEALLLAALATLARPGHRGTSGAPEPWRDPFLIVAPRHLDRLQAVERLLAAAGRQSLRRSALALPIEAVAATAAAQGVDVLLLDTLGELADAYALGWVAVVGGGFAGRGGHNLLEPAARGRAVVFGPGHRSPADEAERLEASGGGIRCAQGSGPEGARALGAALRPFLADPGLAALGGERARQAVEEARGAARRAVAFLVERLHLEP